MFGTMILQLPSKFKGGQIIVEHDASGMRLKHGDLCIKPTAPQLMTFVLIYCHLSAPSVCAWSHMFQCSMIQM